MEMPVEMIEEILVTLSVKTLLRFKCVCKGWCDVIESRRFVDRHYCHDSNRDRLVFRRLLHNIKDKTIEEQFEEANGDVLNLDYFVKCKYRMGPVNGVFCEVSLRGDITIVLLNPATREVKRLPSLPPLSPPWSYLRFGFGLDPSTGDYKTVAFYAAEFACVHTSSSFSSSSSKSNSSDSSECWRFIEGVDPSLLSSLRPLLFQASLVHLRGGFCNGVYYWVCQGILAFDTITETFREIEPLPGVGDLEMDLYFGGIGVYGGSIALFMVWRSGLSDIWVLGKGNGGCWSKILSFPMATTMSPPCVTNIGAGLRWTPVCVWKNEVVFQDTTSSGIYGPNLIMVDVCTHRVRPLRVLRPNGLSDPFCYKQSLVSFIPNRLTTNG